MELRAFGVCRMCSEVYPSMRGCPSCDSDQEAAEQVRAARAVAISSASEAPLLPSRLALGGGVRQPPGWQWKPVLAVVSISLVLSTLIAVLVQA